VSQKTISQGKLRGTPLLEKHYAKNTKGGLLLAYHLCRHVQRSLQLPQMSYFRREKKVVALATKVDLSRGTVHAVGFGFHRGNKSTILDIAQMDTHYH
jgi:hypothetical protein